MVCFASFAVDPCSAFGSRAEKRISRPSHLNCHFLKAKSNGYKLNRSPLLEFISAITFTNELEKFHVPKNALFTIFEPMYSKTVLDTF